MEEGNEDAHSPDPRTRTPARPHRSIGRTPPEEENQTDGETWEEEAVSEESVSEPERDYEQDIAEFRQWLQKEPYLPRNLDNEILISFLHDAESVEEAEEKLTNYYYARQSMRAVFHDRHPCSPNNLLKYNAVCVVPLTGPLDRKWIIFMTWLVNSDPAKFSIYHMAKLIFTELDILLQENQVRGKTVSVIFNMKDFTETHTQMITKYAAKKICYLFTQCFPAKFNGFYVINAPQHVSSYTGLFGCFDFHIVDYVEDLTGFLPKKFLPSDVGGDPDAPEVETYFEPFFKRLKRCGNWLAYEEFLRSQELLLRMTTDRSEFTYTKTR